MKRKSHSCQRFPFLKGKFPYSKYDSSQEKGKVDSYGDSLSGQRHLSTLEFCSVAEKPGQCPGEQPGMAGICVVNCEDDWSCPGAQKCCGSCPRDCAIPVRERSGRCPIPPQGTVTTCELRCVNDYECPWPKKCCKYGCKTDCFYPV
ncbi:peptide [Podarcis lilfordi]|uniref:Peptide n=1 Tax=Podarcis lilfordi TaxID=74358 RepID=A0AA35KHW6_9SAUR|nr:peptide [Podarcis lilfordi]